jgi:hypothetical protein
MTDDEVLDAARQLFEPSSGWSLRLERRGERLTLRAEHQASHGLALDIDTWTSDSAEHLEWWSHQREVAVAAAAPQLVHPELVMGLRTLTVAYRWGAAELRGIAFLLFEVQALTLEETSWLSGYVADDAPMQPVTPHSA